MSLPPLINTITPKTLTPLSIHNHLFATLSLLFLFSSTKPNNLHLKTPTPTLSFHQSTRPRRVLLRNPIMSNSNPNPFSTPQSLFDWLHPRLPSDSFAAWGTKPGTKNIHNLWLELSEGESSLVDSTPPIRTVHVVTVRISNGNGGVLVEAYQELSDGTMRERFRPLSEKMKPGESVETAVVRGIKEELGSIIEGDVGGSVRIVPGSYEEKVEERESSVSYPGLPACYVLHSVEALVDGLPDGDFCTLEEGENVQCSEVEAVFVKKHFWKWIGASNSN